MIWTSVEALTPAVLSQTERLESVAVLLALLAHQCPGIVARVVPQWREKPDPAAGFESIASGLEGCARPWVLFVQDDVKLTANFGELAAQLLPLADDVGALSLFSPWPRDVDFLRAGRTQYEAVRPFVYAQCLLLRCELAHAWAKELRNWTGHPRSDDNALTPAADKLRLRVLISLPSLAQHLGVESAFGNQTRSIQSPTFVSGIMTSYLV